jgi:hypothetical protein
MKCGQQEIVSENALLIAGHIWVTAGCVRAKTMCELAQIGAVTYNA